MVADNDWYSIIYMYSIKFGGSPSERIGHPWLR